MAESIAASLNQAKEASRQQNEQEESNKEKNPIQESVQTGAKQGSRAILTSLWSSVWLDFTLLSLLGLNAFLFASIMMPSKVCQFGEDHVIGKFILDKQLAKYVEIIILAVLDALVASVVLFIVYVIYKIVDCSMMGMVWGFVTGGGVKGTVLQCIKP